MRIPIEVLTVIRDQTWRDDALCAEVGGDEWYPEQGGTAAPAKRVCRRCPVTTECLDYALETNDRFGVWGGLSPRERDRLLNRVGAA